MTNPALDPYASGWKRDDLTPESNLHSRAMAPHNRLQDKHVAFYGEKSMSWASFAFAGTASISQDREHINRLWTPIMAAYLGDLMDGVHRGDENDPRLCIIEAVLDEIRYWLSTRGSVSCTSQNAYATVETKASDLEEARTITKGDLAVVLKSHARFVTPTTTK